MSIPLVQNNEKDSINTSIIAIKRNIERINMLLGLSNSEEIDTSEFVKKSDIVDEVTVGNMQSVTSNAVAVALSYDLLWTNTSPNSPFEDQIITAQTLGVDLSQYKSIKIYFKFATGDNSSFFQEVLKNKATRLSAISDYMFTREVMFTDSGITFGKGSGFLTYGGSRSISNNWVIPLEIYGVK